MKNLCLSALLVFAACVFYACGPSALEIKEMSSECEFNVEVRYMPNDSIALFVGNTLYIATSQLVSESLYPLSVSTRDPMNIDGRAPTDVVNSDEELVAYIQKRVPDVSRFGIVMGDHVSNEIGFDPSATVQRLQEFFAKNYPGSSAVLFGEKAGELISAKKLY